MQNVHLSPPKKPHRRRRSVPALRIAPDTSPTLPAYHQTLHTHGEGEDPIPSDKPPDYPDSADEADEETELDNDDPFGPRPSHYKPPFATPPHTASPRRKRFPQQQQATTRPGRHKRNSSAVPVLKSRTDSSDVDSYLDSLLERSTRALEMSNALLESSISTQNTMSSFLTSSDYYSAHAESALESRAIGLSSKLLKSWDVQENWTQELSRIKQDVDSLFGDDDDNSRSRRHSRESTGSVSQSVPSTSPLTASRPSVDYLPQHSSQLRYAPQDRATLVSPPPRALTLYIDAGPSGSVSGHHTPESSYSDLPTGYMLPSTLGARPSQPTFHRIADNSYTQTASTSAASSPSPSSRRSPLEPQLTNKPVEASTPAYNMLSSLVARSTNSSVVNLGASASSSTLHLSLPPSTRPSIRDGKQRQIDDTNDTASAPSSFVSSFLSSMTTLARRNSSPSQRPLPGGSNSNSPSTASRLSRPTTTKSASTSRHHSPVVRKRSASADQHSLASSRSSRSSRRSGTHNQLSTNESPTIQVRQMTPPTEGTDEDAEGESSSSSSSSDGVVAKQTVLSLRKILDEQPPPPPPPPSAGVPPSPLSKGGQDEDADSPAQPQARKPRAPAFMPRTPTGTASAGTSTATASISRLFTKGVHTSSARPRSPPLRSVMKRRLEGSTGEGYSASVPVSPSHSVSSFTAGTMTPPSSGIVQQQQQATTPSTSSAGAGISSVPVGSTEAGAVGEGSPVAVGRLGHIAGLGTLVTRALSASTLQLPQSAGANGDLSAGSSAPSSGRSTPKRISFAQLPESYASTKPEGEAGSVERRKNSRKKSKSSGSSGGMSRKRSSSDPSSRDDGNGSWWQSWLGAADLASGGSGLRDRDRERMEDRTTRRMGMTMGMGGGGHLSAMDEWGV